MFGWLSDARSCASRSKRASRSGSRGERSRQNLDRDVALELRVARAIDLAHAAGAEGGEDLVGPETSTGTEGHEVGRRIVSQLPEGSLPRCPILLGVGGWKLEVIRELTERR